MSLVAELRKLAANAYNTWQQPAIEQAADEIERLTARVAELEDAQIRIREDDAYYEADLEAKLDLLEAALEKIANQSAQDYEDPEEEAYASREIARKALGKG